VPQHKAVAMSDPNDDFSKLFSGSRAALLGYVRRLVRSGEAAEEIVQEAFLRTYERAHAVASPRAFVLTTARNLAWKFRRHERIAQTDSVGDFDDTRVLPHANSPEAQLLADERAQLLMQAVQRLPPQCRAAFTLRVFHACSYQEIADRLGVSIKTVEKHLMRGLRDTHVYLKRRYRDVR
jgi:RNA polymerase sigma-70 factor, ECF subfamily